MEPSTLDYCPQGLDPSLLEDGPGEKEEALGNSIRALTWNACGGLLNGREIHVSVPFALASGLGRPSQLLEGFELTDGMPEIAEEVFRVRAKAVEVIAFQEVIPERHRNILTDISSENFPYSSFSPACKSSGRGAAGVFLTTKAPSEDIEMNDVPYFSGVVGRHIESKNLSVFNAHFPLAFIRKTKVSEAWKCMIRLIEREHKKGRDVLVLGDFNETLTRIHQFLRKVESGVGSPHGHSGHQAFQIYLGKRKIPDWIMAMCTRLDLDNGLFFPHPEHTGSVRLDKAEVHPTPATSDHLPLEVWFTWKSNRAA